MSTVELDRTVYALIADGKGILAADETPGTLTKRFEARAIASTPESRRAYREMLFATPDIGRFISGVIMQDETIHQKSASGEPLAYLLENQGVIPGIKVDTGVTSLAGLPGETITEGLDDLRERLVNYRSMGARFAKWRAVIRIDETIPTPACIKVNAHALARYAALCQEQGVVPIVEPEVLMEGHHNIERCEAVTGSVLHAVFNALVEQRVSLEGMLLKPNMVIPGKQSREQAVVERVASATLRCLRRHVPAAVPGIVFLSGGQDHIAATLHLNAINRLDRPKPWKLSFSFGRALQDEALRAWQGTNQNLQEAQTAFAHRAGCLSAATAGKYTGTMERQNAA